MNPTVCMATAHTLFGSANAAHLWIFINWALGLRAIGCRVFWLEDVGPLTTPRQVRDIEVALSDLRDRLGPLGLADDIDSCGGPA
jgi:hypothetical protein